MHCVLYHDNYRVFSQYGQCRGILKREGALFGLLKGEII